jgi:dolichyl-phosphate-mannose--protein O-mannosyl transferase
VIALDEPFTPDVALDLPPPPDEPPALARRLPRSARLLTAAAGVATLVTRLPGLDRPKILVFDEVYYASQGLEIANGGVEQGQTVHPPLAKWLIGAGIRVFGFNSFGWRVVPLLAGIVVVMATVVAAYRLLNSLWLAGLAGFVVLTDGIAFTTGRLALLDGIMAAFATATLAVLLTVQHRPLDVPLRRRATLACAVLMGCAIACKWSAALLLLITMLVLMGLAVRTTPTGRRRRELLLTGAVLLGVPMGIYCASYLPTMVRFEQSAIGRDLCTRTGDCDPSVPARLGAIWRDQRKMLDFHRHLEPTNKYAHLATSWVFQTEPVGLMKTHCPSADPVCSPDDPVSVRRVIGIGNPMIWVLGTLALIATTILALWRLDEPLGIVVLWAAALWLPWMFGPRAGYTFYAAPLVPAIGLAIAVAVHELRGRWRAGIGVTVAAIALMGAIVLYPVWTAHPTSKSYLEELVDN